MPSHPGRGRSHWRSPELQPWPRVRQADRQFFFLPGLQLASSSTSIRPAFVEGSSPAQTEEPHFKVRDLAFCSADRLFAQFSKPGNSAPGAPAATPGTTFDVVLPGRNPITQIVDPRAWTITNITQVGHRYHSGSVEIRINPTWYGSSVLIAGKGTGPRALENSIGGWAIFTALAARATIACTAGVD